MTAIVRHPIADHGGDFAVRELGAFDNVALLALARQCDTGSDRFRVDRAPEYFALLRFFSGDEHRVWGVVAPDVHRLVGSMVVSTQRRYLRGEPVAVDYLHDLRIHPEYRCTTACLRLLAAVAAETTADRPRIATVLGDNPRGSALVRHAGRYFGAARCVAETWHRTATASAPVGDLAVVPMGDAAWLNAHRLWAGRRDGAADSTTVERALEHAERRGVRDARGRIVGVFADVDQRRERTLRAPDGQAVDVRYPAFFAAHPDHEEGALAAARADILQRHPRAIVAWGAPVAAQGQPAGALRSTTWAFGDAPVPQLTAHELTLI